MSTTQTNDRGEFTDAQGNLWHRTSVEFNDHQGDWLSCEGCNPPVVVDASSATDSASRLADLRDEYAMAKDQSGIAEERLKAAKSKLQAAIAEASGGAYRVELRVPGYKPVTLVYTEPWTLDSKALKAEQPAVYVQYAKRGQRWTLAESRAKS